ncbi:MAG: hypothetical protein M1840_007989 [Geoglossum simile]|nr:MAG: hypothetical protein M1840_007989 [Geoglossum simile]
MLSPLIDTFPSGTYLNVLTADGWLAVLAVAIFATVLFSSKDDSGYLHTLNSYLTFFYASFLKPRSGDSQQDAMESFYEIQARAYDTSRRKLLRGREDMLGLAAAQLKLRVEQSCVNSRPIWVDIRGGTSYNIEAMSSHLPVAEFFSSIYLVDLSPSLCKVARRRFARLGWTNVKVVCQDARSFRLWDHETNKGESEVVHTSKAAGFPGNSVVPTKKADLLTMSYSLSMIPNYHLVVDTMSSLLSPSGVLGVIDFYVQSKADLAGRNYTGGAFNRHVNWFGRVFWRAWFEADRVGLEPGRRDYLEYRFGTILSVDDRNYIMGGIPYYIWIGFQQQPVSPLGSYPHEIIERLDAAVTESPYASPVDHTNPPSRVASSSVPPDIRSKVFNAAILNLTANLLLPSFFYQNHHWRIHYDEQLKKHTYDDVVLAVTSAGDNILAYALNGPKRIHSVDLNPTQNHLLELKVAAFTALSYTAVWKLFGEGKHVGFRDLLVSKLSPHMSSRAFQYWLDNAGVFASQTGGGLYGSGCSRHAIKLVKWLFRSTGLHSEVQKLCRAETLNEQREIWYGRIRKVLLSRVLVQLVAGNPNFLWKALGVPKEQREMIQKDYSEQDSPARTDGPVKADITGNAIREYLVNTLDPVIENTLLSEDNYFYMLCLQGKYSRRCHPSYLTPKAHVKLSRPDAFDGLRIHTDEINEVMSRIAPGTVTVAIKPGLICVMQLMDSMDWFSPTSAMAGLQVAATNRPLKLGGRVLLRSAGFKPWYIQEFEMRGFTTRRVSLRLAGACIDRYIISFPAL